MAGLLYPFLAALIVMAVSLAGVIFSMGPLGTWMRKYLTYLASFSGGVFLLIAYSLAEEAVHAGGWLSGVTAVICGALLMEVFQFFFPGDHHHHGHAHDHTHNTLDGRRVLISDALHNVGDGILLVGAFATNWYIGLAATFGVIVHEAVQEISQFFVLKEAGYTTREALTRNLFVSSTILIGLLFTYFLASVGTLLSLLSGIAAGGFISVILHDLIPHALASIRKQGGLGTHISAALIGILFMLGIQTLIPHSEVHLEEPDMETTTQTTTTLSPTVTTEPMNSIPIPNDSAPAAAPTPTQTPSVGSTPTVQPADAPLSTQPEVISEPVPPTTEPLPRETPQESGVSGSAPESGTSDPLPLDQSQGTPN